LFVDLYCTVTIMWSYIKKAIDGFSEVVAILIQ